MRHASGVVAGSPEAVRRIRVEVLHMTQEQLAGLLWTTTSTVSKWERGGVIHPTTIVALCTLAGEDWRRWYPNPPAQLSDIGPEPVDPDGDGDGGPADAQT